MRGEEAQMIWTDLGQIREGLAGTPTNLLLSSATSNQQPLSKTPANRHLCIWCRDQSNSWRYTLPRQTKIVSRYLWGNGASYLENTSTINCCVSAREGGPTLAGAWEKRATLKTFCVWSWWHSTSFSARGGFISRHPGAHGTQLVCESSFIVAVLNSAGPGLLALRLLLLLPRFWDHHLVKDRGRAWSPFPTTRSGTCGQLLLWFLIVKAFFNRWGIPRIQHLSLFLNPMQEGFVASQFLLTRC